MNYKIIIIFLFLIVILYLLYSFKKKEAYDSTSQINNLFQGGMISDENIILLFNAYELRNPDLLNGNQTLLNYYNMLINSSDNDVDTLNLGDFEVNRESLDNKKTINLRGDFFIKDIDENIKDVLKNKIINTSKVCIYDEDVNDPDKIDVECINAQELFSKIDLPLYRKNKLCIDDRCLDKRDLEVLNGTRSFKIISDHTYHKWNNKCINQNSLRGSLFNDSTCASFPLGNTSNPYSTYFYFQSLIPDECSSSTSFKFVKGKNNKETIANIFNTGISDASVVIPENRNNHH